jgi:hypothetical protein
MNKYPSLYKLGSISLLVLCSLTISSCRYRRGQLELAEQLNVTIGDYPYTDIFPAGYFDTILIPGMPIEEVHEKVLGYEKVIHCGTYKEVYYYFGTEDDKALRFEVLYDDDFGYEKLETEDDDSRTIYTKGCVKGLLSR